jgi:hypothetical protein
VALPDSVAALGATGREGWLQHGRFGVDMRIDSGVRRSQSQRVASVFDCEAEREMHDLDSLQAACLRRGSGRRWTPAEAQRTASWTSLRSQPAGRAVCWA